MGRFAFRSLIVVALYFLSATQAVAQATASQFTDYQRYDVFRRVVGVIRSDPDGAGSNPLPAVRNTYDLDGRLTSMEAGSLSAYQPDNIAPSAWPGFSLQQKTETTYDVLNRKVTELVRGSDLQPVSLTQYSYNSAGLLECTAVRMNPGAFGNLPSSACSLGTQGSNGPDRITKNVYDAADRLIQVRKAVETSLEVAEATYWYTLNGKMSYLVDGNGNRMRMNYDGFDRQSEWVFASTARATNFDGSTQATAWATAASESSTDYEAYTYDANGNRKSLRKRDGNVINFDYDALNRMTLKDIPGGTGSDVYYNYDLRGLQLYARFGSISGSGITSAYDGLGRLTSSTTNVGGTSRTLSYEYDANGNRKRLTYPDGNYMFYEYDSLDRMTTIRENGGAVIALIGYDNQGRRSGLSTSVNTTYGYDPVGRLSSIGHDLAGSYQDVTYGFTSYNAQSQLLTRTISNNSYTWTGASSANSNYTTNGLNQYTAVGGGSISYDANGNLTGDPCYTYGYDVENRLTQRTFVASGTCPVSYAGATNVTLSYDPNGRLNQTADSAATTRYLYDGDALIAEYDGSNNLLRRYVHGSGVDEPLVWYEGSGLGNRRALRADHQGSVIAVTDGSGNSISPNTYDEYGQPSAYNLGRFQYTGQIWLPEVGLYHYKARVYSPKLGRFLQTDPIGYEDQVNLYAYVRNDPVNRADPTGTQDSFEAATRRDDEALLNDQISEQEYRDRQTARGAGGVGGALIVGTTLATRGFGLPVLFKATGRLLGIGEKAAVGGLSFSSKQAARTALDGPVGAAANRFFRDASKNARNFRITDTVNKGKRFEFFSPARNKGYGKLYVQEVDKKGAIIREYKDTLGPNGLIERKLLHGEVP